MTIAGATNWFFSGFGAVLFSIVLLGGLQLVYYVVGGGIPGTAYYFARRLRDPSPQVRHEALKDLVSRGDAFAVRLLMQALQDGEVPIRLAAIEALGKLKDPAVLPALIPLATDRHLAVQLKAIEALGAVPTPEVCAVLSGVLQTGDSRAKLLCLRVFKEVNDPYALGAIARLVLELDEQVATGATAVLLHYGPSAVAPLAALLPASYTGAKRLIRTILEIDRDGALEPLKEAFAATEDPVVLKELLGAFATLGAPGTAAFLLPFLDDPGFPAREGILDVAPSLRDPLLVGPLCALLGSDDVRLRRKAATALDQLVASCRDLEVVEPLCEALKSEDPEVRRYAARALGRVGGELVQQRVIETLWGLQALEVKAHVEGVVGYPMGRMVTFDERILALDRLLTSHRPSAEALRAVDHLESLMIVLHGPSLRGQRVDDMSLDLLVKGRRTLYPLRLHDIHPLASGLLEFVASKAEGDRWRASSLA
ncbi:MAG TPA: HEAT repeat domain-containing protein [Pantanalinema sp.]